MFYDRFMELCRDKGLSPGGAAARIGFNRASINVWRNSGNPPKRDLLVKIASFFGVTTDYLLGLEQKNEREKRLVPVLGLVRAGRPLTAVSDVLGYEEVGPGMGGGELFALHIKGDSMEPRFYEGDTVIVRKQQTAETGDIVVALIGEEDATIKKFCRMKDGILLQPLNIKYEPMFFPNEELDRESVKILGKVIELRARL
ncbi:MAG: helix-turn-helix domain-containing protein [Clostridiales bacterium]|jgi:repressor LexA|nr:helix-turn-helix domain-containing protein [Clostridiales bacterium]